MSRAGRGLVRHLEALAIHPDDVEAPWQRITPQARLPAARHDRAAHRDNDNPRLGRGMDADRALMGVDLNALDALDGGRRLLRHAIDGDCHQAIHLLDAAPPSRHRR